MILKKRSKRTTFFCGNSKSAPTVCEKTIFRRHETAAKHATAPVRGFCDALLNFGDENQAIYKVKLMILKKRSKRTTYFFVGTVNPLQVYAKILFSRSWELCGEMEKRKSARQG